MSTTSKFKMIITGVEMPAGKYWVGDPCYFVPDTRWMEWLEAADYLNSPRILVAEIDGYPVAGVGTAYGDGCYPGSDGYSYGVDAGLIGVTPIEVARNVTREDLGTLVEFDKPFVCSYTDGVIRLGHISINTEDDAEDEDY